MVGSYRFSIVEDVLKDVMWYETGWRSFVQTRANHLLLCTGRRDQIHHRRIGPQHHCLARTIRILCDIIRAVLRTADTQLPHPMNGTRNQVNHVTQTHVFQ